MTHAWGPTPDTESTLEACRGCKVLRRRRTGEPAYYSADGTVWTATRPECTRTAPVRMKHRARV